MGFRSTFTTEHNWSAWPDWFVEKYSPLVWFSDDRKGPLSAKQESKTYGVFLNLEQDIQKAIDWRERGASDHFVLVWLHECGGITRVEIRESSITNIIPTDWALTDDIGHDYCYGCSDAKHAKAMT